jgi:DNA repair protein RadC
MIVCHNHPSGDPTPSREDIVLTKRLREVGDLVGITLLDHVVVATDGFVSLAERGWN